MVLAPYPVRKKYGFHFWDLGILEWGFQRFLLKITCFYMVSAGFSPGFYRLFPQKYVFNIFVEISVGIFCGDFLGKCCQNMFPLFLLTFLLVLFVRIFFGISSELFLYFLGLGIAKALLGHCRGHCWGTAAGAKSCQIKCISAEFFQYTSPQVW